MTTKAATANTLRSIQLGCRVFLTDTQRSQLKAAYQAQTAIAPVAVEGKGISVATASRSSVDAELGMDRLTFSSLMAQRDSIALPLILRFERVLGVKLIDEKTLRGSFDSYIEHLKEEHGLR